MTIGDPYSRDAAVSGRTVALPLLHQPGPYEAGDPALERFRRNWLVSGIGEAGQARLAAARVLVVGAGGLGSPVLLYLTGRRASGRSVSAIPTWSRCRTFSVSSCMVRVTWGIRSRIPRCVT